MYDDFAHHTVCPPFCGKRGEEGRLWLGGTSSCLAQLIYTGAKPLGAARTTLQPPAPPRPAPYAPARPATPRTPHRAPFTSPAAPHRANQARPRSTATSHYGPGAAAGYRRAALGGLGRPRPAWWPSSKTMKKWLYFFGPCVRRAIFLYIDGHQNKYILFFMFW